MQMESAVETSDGRIGGEESGSASHMESEDCKAQGDSAAPPASNDAR